MIHPVLWLPILGACVALPLLGVAAVWLARRWSGLSKRRRWVLFGALAAAELAVWLNVYAWLVEPNFLTVRRVTIESAAWDGAPLTIAAIGDLHVGGPHMRARRVQQIMRRVNALEPELVVLLGDFAPGHTPREERAVGAENEITNGISYLATLDAPLGAAAVLGNHDGWYDRAAVTHALQAAGVATLWNRHIVIERGGQTLVLAGLADLWTGKPDLAETLDGAPADADVIVLSHNPDPFAFDDVRGTDFIAMLAAHTHCGQVWVPFLGRPVIPSRYGQRFAGGLIEEDGRQMFVTCGVGTSSGLPVRFLTFPEIVLITIERPGDDAAPAQAPPRESGGGGSG